MKTGKEKLDVDIQIEENWKEGEGFRVSIYEQVDNERPCHVFATNANFKDKQAALLYIKEFIRQLENSVKELEE